MKHKKIKISEKFGTDPFVDWGFILFGFFILSLCLVGFGIYIFTSTLTEITDYPAAPVKAPVKVDTIKLKAVTEVFEARADEQSELVKKYVGSTDPSR